MLVSDDDAKMLLIKKQGLNSCLLITTSAMKMKLKLKVMKFNIHDIYYLQNKSYRYISDLTHHEEWYWIEIRHLVEELITFCSIFWILKIGQLYL